MGDYAIQMQFDIAADDPTLRRALTTTDGIRSWWSTRSDLSDGQLEVSFPDVPQPFEFIAPFRHGGYEADNPVIPIVTPAWAQIVLRLKGYAESGTPDPFFSF